MHGRLVEVKAFDGPGRASTATCKGAEAGYRLASEVEGKGKPCCVADLVFRCYN